MKVAIAGGSGQLGTLIARRLVDDRRVERVTSIDALPPLLASTGKLRAIELDPKSGSLERWLEDHDAVVHVASGAREEDENVLRCAARAGAKQVVHVGASALPEAPAGLEVANLRPAIAVGSRMDHPLGAFLRFRTLPDRGGAPLPLVWDEDVADAAILALKGKASGSFDLVADDVLAARSLAHETGLRSARLPPGALDVASRVGFTFEVPEVGSPQRAKEVLGWAPKARTAAEVVKRFLQTAAHSEDAKMRAFMITSDLAGRMRPADPRMMGIEARVSLWLTGEGGGDYTLHLSQGKLRITAGSARPPTSVVTVSAAHWRDLMAGAADIATSQIVGKVRIDGDPVGGMAVAGFLNTLRTEGAQGGARGAMVRGLTRWVSERSRS